VPAAFGPARVARPFFAPPRLALLSFCSFLASAALRHGIASASGMPCWAAANRESGMARSAAAMPRR
jgi:hypothetical protein